ncbi:MAG TPA: zinc/iron-chelating domain-containing protein [Verrucomicrobiales bacterium]|nr:zinc/iron-chelating domain-containing protein [Verrucomicrobiales bacterium]HRJ11509.1 YkgJ family cysteine cluster protein [Prosthecobacter sp.]HRK16233.1 YkgJ family cysteine cluster protein [Prosthecobacter sp.]
MPETSPLDTHRPFYQCVRCGNCCRWPGDINITAAEAAAIAAFLGIPEQDFIQNHTRLNANRTGLSIVDKPDGSCLFLEGVNTCLIQPVKPAQCSGFPNEWNFPGWRDQCEAVEV